MIAQASGTGVAHIGKPFLFDTLAVSAATVIAKMAGTAKTLVMAGFFRPGSALDSYLIAFLIPSFITDVFCGAFAPALVPRLMELGRSEAGSAAAEFYNRALFRALLVFCLGGAVLAASAAAVLMLPRYARFPNLGLTCQLLLIMAPILPASAAANVWRSLLNASGQFALPALTAVFTPIVVTICIFAAAKQSGVWILAVGTSLGAAVELAALAIAVRRMGFRILPEWRGIRGSKDPVYREYGCVAATNLILSGSPAVDQFMAAMLAAGSISVLNFGTRLPNFLLAVGPAALSVTILPRLSEMAAQGDWMEMRRTFGRLLLITGLVSVGLTAVLVWFSEPVATLVFQRGAFTRSDTHAVAVVQTCALLQLPFVAGIAILTRLIASVKANRSVVPMAAAALLVNAALNCLFMNWLGAAGIALSTSVVQALLFAALAQFVFSRGGSRILREMSVAR